MTTLKKEELKKAEVIKLLETLQADIEKDIIQKSQIIEMINTIKDILKK